MIDEKNIPASTDDFFYSDAQFNKLYPASIQLLAKKHWTPLKVAFKAANYLAEKNAKILDIGSGAGKFCIAAAYAHPQVQFFGIEQRPSLVKLATETAQFLDLKNVHFFQGNFNTLDFKEYDHFYFYNSFYENIVADNKIDEEVLQNEQLFKQYNLQLHHILSRQPVNTRLATYHSTEKEIPSTFMEIGIEEEGLLKLWLKQ